MRDLVAARLWYRRSAAGDCAQGHLGYALVIAGEMGQERKHGIGTARDPATADRLFRQATETKYPMAQARLGAIFLEGREVPRDADEAETWLRRAALANDAEAATRVGQIYATAGAIPPNRMEAAFWLEHAARAGHRGAAHALGLLHLSGVGVWPNPHEFARWFAAAAAANRREPDDLARVVLCGGPCDNHPSSMVRRFQAEAQAGDPFAQFGYAACLATGVGTTRDEAAAVGYLRRPHEKFPARAAGTA